MLRRAFFPSLLIFYRSCASARSEGAQRNVVEMSTRHTVLMLATTLLAVVIAVFAVLLGSVALLGRSTARARAIGSGRDRDAGWTPVLFSDSGGTDCSDGDAGCDSGGDGGGGD